MDSLVAAIIGAGVFLLFSIVQENMKQSKENISNQRIAWRDDNRKLTKKLTEYFFKYKYNQEHYSYNSISMQKIKGLEALLIVSLNNKAKFEDKLTKKLREAIKELEGNNFNKAFNSLDNFNREMSSLMKHDWDKSKAESGSKFNFIIFMLNILTIIAIPLVIVLLGNEGNTEFINNIKNIGIIFCITSSIFTLIIFYIKKITPKERFIFLCKVSGLFLFILSILYFLYFLYIPPFSFSKTYLLSIPLLTYMVIFLFNKEYFLSKIICTAPYSLEDYLDSNETPEEALESAYQKIRGSLANELLDQVISESPDFFEQLVVDLVVAMGYGGSIQDAGEAIGRTGDEGIDGIIKEDKLGLDVIYIKAKRWINTVGRRSLQQFEGALQGKKARKGIFITTATFSSGAIEYVKSLNSKIVLIDGKQLAQLMIDHNIGVSQKVVYSIKAIDSDYFNSNYGG